MKKCSRNDAQRLHGDSLREMGDKRFSQRRKGAKKKNTERLKSNYGIDQIPQ